MNVVDLYNIPGDTGFPWRLKKFVEYQHEVPSIHYRVLGEYIYHKKLNLNDSIMMCWYMSVTYNEITCMLLHELIDWKTFTTKDFENLWKKHKSFLDFGSARKYAKNMDWFVPLMENWIQATNKEPYEWVKSLESNDPEVTYDNVRKALLSFPYVGRFASDLFLECLVYLKDYLDISIKEPLVLDWKNCSNLTSGIFNIFYQDDKANEYDKTGKLCDGDIEYLTKNLKIIQNVIHETYPDQDYEITMFIGKICSFRNLFKNARYAGFHHDRELGVIKAYERNYPQYQNLWDCAYDIRKTLFDPRFLGEIGGWNGIRKERKKMFLTQGLTGAETI